MKKNKIVMGLTGGIASGKSTVLNEFKELGAKTFDCDIIARKVVKPGKPAYRKIKTAFGMSIVNKDKTVNRGKLAEIIFKNKKKRRALEKIIHPAVKRELEKEIRRTKSGLIVIDIPLLFEANWKNMVDKIIVVWTPLKKQVSRLTKRNHLPHRGALRRIRAQWPLEKKKKMADFVIDNSRSPALTRSQVKELFRFLHTIS